ncbi:MAG: hypothetical protein OXK76_19280 [Gammaproteobacteria bacterium]|nr:hypothetical protein [Gammaproteobacteria bacterium]
MEFSIDWVPGGDNASAEERSTLCDLKVSVGGRNVSAFYDVANREAFDAITLPAVHLAGGIAGNWWRIFGGRDVTHHALHWRTGFALPDLRLEFDGSVLLAQCDPYESDNPQVLFMRGSTEYLPRRTAEASLAALVDAVVDKLAGDGIGASEVQLAWTRVQESRTNKAESAFCEAAGAFGVDPYAISVRDAAFIERTGNLFDGETVAEFLAGVRVASRDNRTKSGQTLDWVSSVRGQRSERWRLPELATVAKELHIKRRRGERPWAWGHRAAQAMREKLALPGTQPVSIKKLSTLLGNGNFARKQGPQGLFAVVAQEAEVVHLHLRKHGAGHTEKFAFARALGDVVCFPGTPLSAINNLHNAERQAVGRAFAAEFLAPVQMVLEMYGDGLDIDEIARQLDVNPMVVNHQVENHAARVA